MYLTNKTISGIANVVSISDYVSGKWLYYVKPLKVFNLDLGFEIFYKKWDGQLC